MAAEISGRRGRRAAGVTQLAALREETGLADDSRWQVLPWRSLDELPGWCGLNAEARLERVTIAGAVALLPAIRRCLRGERLQHLSELIGTTRLDALRRRPYRASIDEVQLAEGAGLERQVRVHGVRVLVTEVADPVLRALLFEMLSIGQPSIKDGDSDAESVLHEARDIDPQAGRIAAELHGMSTEAFGDRIADAVGAQPGTKTVRVKMARGD